MMLKNLSSCWIFSGQKAHRFFPLLILEYEADNVLRCGVVWRDYRGVFIGKRVKKTK